MKNKKPKSKIVFKSEKIDCMNGPLVVSAQKALEEENINKILPWIPEDGREIIEDAFEKTIRAKKEGETAEEIAKIWFYETCVKIYKEANESTYNGLKPPEEKTSPVIKALHESLEQKNPEKLKKFLISPIEKQLEEKIKRLTKDGKFDVEKISEEWAKNYLDLLNYAKKIQELS